MWPGSRMWIKKLYVVAVSKEPDPLIRSSVSKLDAKSTRC